jgi:hypothetical protein
MVIGIIWFILYNTTTMGMTLFPKNYMQMYIELNTMSYTVIHGGLIFGMNMIFLAVGYITVISLYETSTFRP